MSERTAAPIQIAIAVIERDGCYLVGRRPDGVPLAGLWEFPGGKVEPGETVEHAATRECLEEAGISVKVGSAYGVVEHQYEHARVRLSFLACTPLPPSAEPKPPFEWRPAAELADLPFPKANAEIIPLLVSRFTQGCQESSH
jgi:mutator protein MutT